MDIKGNGVTVNVDPAEQTDDWLLSAAQEITEAAEARGLELPVFAGNVVIEAAEKAKSGSVVEHDPSGVKEAIAEQLGSTFTGYRTTAEQINSGRNDKEQIDLADKATLAKEFEAWFTAERLDYVKSAMEANPGLCFTLTAKPNVLVTPAEIIAAERKFGEDQPYATDVWSDILKLYTPEEVSGTNPESGNSVAFSLIPSKTNPALYGSVQHQKNTLKALQAENPFLKDSRPLDDLVYANTLRAGGNKLVGNGVLQLTHQRNYGMEIQRIDRFVYVPFSLVASSGERNVGFSYARVDDDARVLVG